MSPVDGLSVDVAVVGGGIAGATAAAHLAPHRSLVLLEQERELAYHTTSRSAAMFFESDDDGVFAKFVAGSRRFFETSHPELDAPLLRPRSVLILGDADHRVRFADAITAARARGPHVELELVEGPRLIEICPVLTTAAAIGRMETTSAEIDVMSLHQLFVRRVVAEGGVVARSAKVGAMSGGDSRRWRLQTDGGVVEADLVVNAAGAWADQVAIMAGATRVGLSPLRRTAFTVPIQQDPGTWPFVYSEIEGLACYFKPEAGNQLLCSPADETAMEPGDARPEEIDVALAIDRINTLTTLGLRSVATAWAGQRTFSPDRVPVWGFDDRVEGFFWFAGQGGWGIGTAPAAGLFASGLIVHGVVPEPLAELGVEADALSPTRFR